MPENNKESVLLSIVIPAYNEVQRIGPALVGIISYFAARRFRGEIIVADDGSTDATSAEALKIIGGGSDGLVLTLPGNRGKGRAVREGVLASSGEYVLFCDADMSVPIGTTDRVLELLASESDVVIASRALEGSDIRIRQTRLRESMGRTFNRLARMLMKIDLRDTQCGFKGFRRSAAMTLFSDLKTEGFAFDVEVLMKARALGYRISEIPVVWCDSRPSRVDIVRSSCRMLRELAGIRSRVKEGDRRRP